MYPPEHPSLDGTVGPVLEAMGPALEDGEPLVVDVHRDHLAVAERGGPGQRELLRELAGRLHEHRVARLEFHPELGEEELGALLTAVGREPSDDGEESELAGTHPGWPHIEVVPLEYDGLVMGDESTSDETGAGDGVWVGLVRFLAYEDSPPEQRSWTEVSVAELATRLEEITAGEAESRAVEKRLREVADALAGDAGTGPGGGDLRRRFAGLLEHLGGETLREVLSGQTEDQRRDFLRSCTRGLPVQSAARVVRELTADRSPGGELTLRLLAKLDRRRSRRGWGPTEDGIRARLGAVVDAETEGRHPGGEDETAEYGAAMGREWDAEPHLPATEVNGAETEEDPRLRVLRAALEVDATGPAARAAVHDLLERDDPEAVLTALRDAPAGADRARRDILDALDVPALARRLLEKDPPDLDAVRNLVAEAGEATIPALIDILAESESQELRRQTFSLLEEVGQTARPHLLQRLHGDDRWYVQRNMLALLASLPEPIDAERVESFRNHDRAAVRIEVYKLLLDQDPPRVEDLRRALSDADRRVVSLGVGAARGSAAEELVPELIDIALDEEWPEDTRRAAVRALSPVQDSSVVEGLADLCRERSWWRPWASSRFRTNPVARAALRGLARHHRDRPDVRGLLEEAADSADAEVRAIVREESP